VVVVGGRCAGAALAIRLGHQGLSVCVIDRATFPSETPSTHAIQACGVRELDALGVRDEVTAATRPITRVVIALGTSQTEVDDVPGLLGAPALNVRRVTLDEILVRAAADAGADVCCDTSVSGLLTTDGRVTGVQTSRGPVKARLVVGADGMRSTVARLVGAEEYATTAPGRMFAWGYLSGVDLDSAPVASTLWLGQPGEHGYLASATDGELFMAVATTDLARKSEFAADREQAYRASFGEWPALEEVVAGGSLEGPVRLVTNWHGYFRESAGPGWALVGDAGHFKDPTPGQGISDAFRQAGALASAIREGFPDPVTLDDALRRYWRWRDDDAWSMYWFASDLGAPGAAAPLLAQVQRQLVTDPGLTEQLARVLNHEQDPAVLTSPRVLARATTRALSQAGPPRGQALRQIAREASALTREELRRRRLRRRRPSARVS
jgi:flavin-dependent dehydrogenase